ncbi:MAG: helix-turn-helix domain-containing protein [Fibrobacteres bacterium]|nr:helix-turn-helix domain-containing protein [Fibrobacterota bacterium]
MEQKLFPKYAAIEAIQGVWKFERPSNYHSKSVSTPGHLLHFMIKGSYALTIGGKRYEAKEGDTIYYHESEPVECFGRDNCISFYSISFTAPSIQPLPSYLRAIQTPDSCKKLFAELYAASLITGQESCFRTHAALNSIWWWIEEVRGREQGNMVESISEWWRLETALRKNKNFQATTQDLVKISGRSYATLQRLSIKEFGIAPIKRIREMRMDEARGLLRYSDLSLTSISNELGYQDLATFSREFSHVNKESPSSWRKRHFSAKNKNLAPIAPIS